jgi:DUF4097 and DUF4098 domain-containing protein YvlB
VQAATVNGQVVVSTSGTVQASTVNGSIDAALLNPTWTTPPAFTAVNGKIKVEVPCNVRADIKAETRNGRVVAEVPDFNGTATEQSLDGSIGSSSGRSGGAPSPIFIRTVNGSIELRQQKY